MTLVPAKIVTIFAIILFELLEPFSNLIMTDNCQFQYKIISVHFEIIQLNL